MHEFMNFNVSKFNIKIHKKIIKQDPGLIPNIRESTCGLVYIYARTERNPFNNQ